MGTEKRLDGKVVLLIGGTGALARAAWARLARAGATVVAVGRDEQPPGEIARGIPGASGRAEWLRIGSLHSRELAGAVQRVLRAHGRIDALVHAAGWTVPGALAELTDEQCAAIMEVNFSSVVAAVRAVLPAMTNQRCGHIVVVGSLGGIVPMPYETLYCASKFALRGFCFSLQEETQASGVNVSLLAPGPFHSPMLRREATDPRAALTFTEAPRDADDVARDLVQLLLRPRRELVTPRGRRLPALVLHLFPGLFGYLFPFLRAAGTRRLRRLAVEAVPSS